MKLVEAQELQRKVIDMRANIRVSGERLNTVDVHPQAELRCDAPPRWARFVRAQVDRFVLLGAPTKNYV